MTLPRELKQKESIEIEIGYEGTIPAGRDEADQNRDSGRKGQEFRLGPDRRFVHRQCEAWGMLRGIRWRSMRPASRRGAACLTRWLAGRRERPGGNEGCTRTC